MPQMEVLALTAHHALMDAVTAEVVAVLNSQVQAARAVKVAPQVAAEAVEAVAHSKLVLGIQVPTAQLEFTHGR